MKSAICAAVALVAAASASAHEFAAGVLTIDHPWASPTPAGQSQSSVYFTIENAADEPDRLIGVSATAGQATLHDNTMDGDVARMTDLETIDVPAHGEVVFARGRPHASCRMGAPET